MKKIVTFIFVLCMMLSVTSCNLFSAAPEVTTPEVTTPEVTTPEVTTPEVTTPEVTTPEVTTPEETNPEIPEIDITLQEVYDAGKNLIALLGNHENVYAKITSNGAVIREEYLSKQYAYSYYSPEFMDIGFEYFGLVTDTSEIYCADGLYGFSVMLSPNGIVEMTGMLELAGSGSFIASAMLNDESATIVTQDGLIIVSCTADLDELAIMGNDIISCVETYTLDATTREMVAVKTVYTYADGTIEEGIVTITRDVEEPEGMKPLVAFAQSEDLRTFTIVSNPGTENEKTESIQIPVGVQAALTPDWSVEGMFTTYDDAACTQPTQEVWDLNSDIITYVKWDESNTEEEIRYTVTPEEWEAMIVEKNFTLERIENGETVTVQKYTEYALDVDGSLFVFIDDKTYQLVEEEDGWFAYDCTYLELLHGGLLEECYMEDFEYDENEKVYVYKYGEEMGCTLTIKFENGLPVNMTIVYFGESSDVVIRLMSNVGTTVIDLPEYELVVEEPTSFPVTEEVWNSFAGETNFEYIISMSDFALGEAYWESHTVRSIGSALVIDDVIYVLDGDQYYVLEETADGWIAFEAELPAFCFTSLLEGLNYNDFAFDERSGYYVTKEIVENEPFAYVSFDKNGNLVYLSIFNCNLSEAPEAEGLNLVAMIGFSNIGTTVIDVPEYELEEDEEAIPSPVTEEVWNSFVGETNFEYAIIIADLAGLDAYSEVHFVKSVGNAIAVDDVLYVLDGGKYYVLEGTENGWVAVESELPAFCFTSLLEGLNYNDFEFDEETGYYVPKEVAENEPFAQLVFDENGNLVNLFIFNENLSENPETEGMDLVAMISFSNIGNNTIDVPEYTIAQ